MTGTTSVTRRKASDLLEAIEPGGPCYRTGHRGARGLAPENTLPAFEAAAEVGVDALEFDVHRTRDGQMVVIHDDTVDRTSDGKGAVAELTLAELRTFDAGYWFTRDGGQTYPYRGRGVGFSTLAEVIESFPKHLFTIEIKPSPYREHVSDSVQAIRDLAPGRVVIGSFAHKTLTETRQRAPEIPTGASLWEIQKFFFLQLAGLERWFDSPAKILQVPRYSNHDHDQGVRVTTAGFVRAAHATGRSVQVWTINRPAVMDELFGLGVDGITTDLPQVLNDALAARSVSSESR
ncbi:MAG: glycerophosphodiester phosphodiesterase [Planctomycetes bacterium]|nr:glycerophosphodiester phosphodiesterase [Planctomycetota bacterium]